MFTLWPILTFGDHEKAGWLNKARVAVCCRAKVNHPEENGSESQSAENGEANSSSDRSKVPKDIYDFYEKMDRDEDDETELQTVSFQINQDTLEKLQKRFVTNVNCILSIISVIFVTSGLQS